MNNELKTIIIHCSDLSYNRTRHQFYAIDRWHKQINFPVSSLGYFCGYHKVSTGGIEYTARKDWEIGAHCNTPDKNGKSYNFQSLGYCMGFDGDVEYPLQKDLENCRRTVKEWQKAYNIPDENVIFHRDVNRGKTCPGSLITKEFLLNPPEKTDRQLEKQKKLKELIGLLDQLRALYELLKQRLKGR